jgi:hypothetical protein
LEKHAACTFREVRKEKKLLREFVTLHRERGGQMTVGQATMMEGR